MFEEGPNGFVFDSGTSFGKVLLSGGEAVVVRHVLYALNLLPYATTIPLLLLTVLGQGFRIYSAELGPLAAIGEGAIYGVILSFGVFAKRVYIRSISRRAQRYLGENEEGGD